MLLTPAWNGTLNQGTGPDELKCRCVRGAEAVGLDLTSPLCSIMHYLDQMWNPMASMPSMSVYPGLNVKDFGLRILGDAGE